MDWYVPRTAEAARVFDLLFDGPVKAFRLFGPRRIGKTWFLLFDIARMARDRGNRVVYVDFWQGDDSDPTQLMLSEIAKAHSKDYVRNRLGLLRKFELKILGTGGSVELASDGAKTSKTTLADALSALSDPNTPTLLLLDEFQRVGDAPNGADFIAVLRSVLNRHPDGLRTIFTGSSEAGLNAIFSAKDAPFFRYAQRLELEKLGSDFVCKLLASVRAHRAITVTDADAMEIFEHYDRSPMWLTRWITKLLAHPSLTAEEARAAIEAEVARDNGYDDLIADLTQAQRIMLWLIADGTAGTTGKAAMDKVANLGLPRPSKSSLDASVQALKRRDLLEKNARHRWQLRDSLLADWVCRFGINALLDP